MNNSWSVVVVSDGCGSSKYAEAGSKLIAELVAEQLAALTLEIEKYRVGD